MFVDTGLVKIQDQQLAYFAGLEWRLYTDNAVISSTTVLADLTTEAAWSGYARVTAGTWNPSIIVDPRAQSTQAGFITFFNTSGTAQNFYVIALVDNISSTLIWANNLGVTTIADGGQYTFGAQLTDKQE